MTPHSGSFQAPGLLPFAPASPPPPHHCTPVVNLADSSVKCQAGAGQAGRGEGWGAEWGRGRRGLSLQNGLVLCGAGWAPTPGLLGGPETEAGVVGDQAQKEEEEGD